MNAYIWSTATALTLALAAGSTPASVGRPVVAAKEATNTDSAPKTDAKRYCVVDNTVTGSRLPRKKCMTRKEWLSQGFDPLAPAS